MLPLQRRQGCWTIPRHRQVIAKEMPSANPHQQKEHSRDRELGMPGEMLFIETCVAGCYEIRFPGQADRRGTFAKPFSFSRFVSRGLEADFVESFHTVSSSNVLRGMHCQLPPGDQSKLAYCVTGSVLDVVLDLRPDSPSFKSYAQVELAADRHNAVFLPRGTCHGFYVRQGPACMIYHVTREYVPHLDAGVSWNSFGASWPSSNPVISERDAALPDLDAFHSPFRSGDEF